jgi:hypothetical protein
MKNYTEIIAAAVESLTKSAGVAMYCDEKRSDFFQDSENDIFLHLMEDSDGDFTYRIRVRDDCAHLDFKQAKLARIEAAIAPLFAE